jgi:glucose/arabinose dehydrogenase
VRLSRVLKVAAISFGALVGIGAAAIGLLIYVGGSDPFLPLYAENCSVCHGERFEGGAQGPALVGRALAHGDAVAQLAHSIAVGFPERGMPGWSKTLSETQIRSLAILIAERRANRVLTDFKVDKPLDIPTAPIASELARFRIEEVAAGLSPKAFSIAPLPDGSMLLTEKVEGLSLIAPDGTRTRVSGTPETTGVGVNLRGIDYGLGWLLDVAPHPDYARNGWIYLAHTDLCATCGSSGSTLIPKTMNRVVRGRIRAGRWLDQQVIWSVPEEFYTPVPDVGAGGRIAFGAGGTLFISVGIKGGYFEGIQDLATPYGKIHRVRDDGRVPSDNPFVSRPGAMASIWTLGHRSPQGLEVDTRTGELWGTEMGPRGGDEVNHLRPGRNYGWPLTSKGVDYDGTPVEYGIDLGLTFDPNEIEQPVVDLTPSPAVSSFVIYRGDAFPEWQDDLIVGSLKASELYRFEIDGDTLVHAETLLTDLARIRDVALGPGGAIYLLLEHASGSRIVRLVRER